MNQQFDFSRFRRLLLNDALDLARPLAFGALALVGMTVLLYLMVLGPDQYKAEPLGTIIFEIALLGGGLLLTSLAFGDMHNPTGRYQYLMLPVSTTERLLSRYLLTGPLFMLLTVVVFAAADTVGLLLARWVNDASDPHFMPLEVPMPIIIGGYFVLHAIALTGAICFRSLALLRTVLWVLVWWVGLATTMYLSLRIFYASAFSWTSIEAEEQVPLYLLPFFAAPWVNYALAAVLVAWMVYVAHRCLASHEVQDGV